MCRSFVHALKEKEETRSVSEKSEEAPEEIKTPSPSKDVKGRSGKSVVKWVNIFSVTLMTGIKKDISCHKE